jgi:hypothetical protein
MNKFKRGDIVGSHKNEGFRYAVLYQRGNVVGVELTSEHGQPAKKRFGYECAADILYLAPEAA